MRNKLFIAGIIIILIFGIIGMGCDGGGSISGGGGSGGSGGGNGGGNGGGSGGGNGTNGGSGNGDYGDGSGSGGSGSGDNGDDGYDNSGSGGSGSSDNNDNRGGSGIIIIGGSGGSGSRSYYTVKFTVTSSDPAGTPVDITYSYPKNNGYNWSAGSSDMNIVRLKTVTTPWENYVSISSKVIGNGVSLQAQTVDNSQNVTLTARIFIDGKQKRVISGQETVFIDWR